MNKVCSISKEQARHQALELLAQLTKTPRQSAANSKGIPFFEFPDGPDGYKFVRGWKYAVGNNFKERLGFRSGEEAYYKAKWEMSELGLKTKKPLTRGRFKGMYKYEKPLDYQTSEFCFKKGDVIHDSPAYITLVGKNTSKKKLSIEGWPDKNRSYIHVREAEPAIPKHTTTNSETKMQTTHQRNPGKVVFAICQDEQETLKTMTQDEFIKFLIGDQNG